MCFPCYCDCCCFFNPSVPDSLSAANPLSTEIPANLAARHVSLQSIRAQASLPSFSSKFEVFSSSKASKYSFALTTWEAFLFLWLTDLLLFGDRGRQSLLGCTFGRHVFILLSSENMEIKNGQPTCVRCDTVMTTSTHISLSRGHFVECAWAGLALASSALAAYGGQPLHTNAPTHAACTDLWPAIIFSTMDSRW